MSALKWMFVCLLTCFLSCSVSQASSEGKDVNPAVILHCHGPKNAAIELLEWIKPDLKSDEYVFFFRDRKSFEDFQHPHFQGRVELADPEMKDGNFSVILKNVTIDDAGTYECHVGKSHSGRSKREIPELINSVTLNVSDFTAHTGLDIILPCRTFRSNPTTTVRWTLENQKDDVFFYHYGRSFPDYQHPVYKNWVELKDSERKDGDASLILKDVMHINSGTFKCRVDQGETNQRTNIINLYVKPPGDGAGDTEDGGEVKTVQPGEDVLLPCQCPRGADIVFVKWIRLDLVSRGFVFYYRDDLTHEIYQHPSFRGRVEQRDPKMKDGDVSVILKNVNIKDTGTYKCQFRSKGDSPEVISSIHLKVKDSGDGAGRSEGGGDRDENVGLLLALPVFLLLVVGVGSFVVYRKHKRPLDKASYYAPDEKDTEHQ